MTDAYPYDERRERYEAMRHDPAPLDDDRPSRAEVERDELEPCVVCGLLCEPEVPSGLCDECADAVEREVDRRMEP